MRYISELSTLVDITLITQIRNKRNIDKQPLQNVEVVYINTEIVASPMHKLSKIFTRDPDKSMGTKVAFRYPSYSYFEWIVWRIYKKRINAGEFDIVHRVSPMSPTIPSPIAKWSKTTPTIIGPILSSPPWPDGYNYERKRDRDWLSYFRNIHRLLPYYKSSYKNAAAILAAYPHTIADLPEECMPRVIDFSEGGVDPHDFPMPEKVINERITILYVGRMVSFKLPELLIECFNLSPLLQRHRLVYIGDGPERERLEEMVHEYQLTGCVEFKGVISQRDVGEIMRESEIFAFPSIREQGGGVITLAAMSGMVPIVVDYGGPSYRVPDGTGIRIPISRKKSLIKSFQLELERLVQDPNRMLSLGRAARQFTEDHYAWNVKAKNTIEVYKWVLGDNTNKPEFR